jgi:hypothetical protein
VSDSQPTDAPHVPATWKQTGSQRWERSDNAVVYYDHSVECDTSRPWLTGHRGWKAFAPGPEEHNYLSYFRKNRRRVRDTRIARKFKTPEAAMAAVDREFLP